MPTPSKHANTASALQLLVAGCHDGLRLYRLEVHITASDAPLVMSDPHARSSMCQPSSPKAEHKDIAAPGARLHVSVQELSQASTRLWLPVLCKFSEAVSCW